MELKKMTFEELIDEIETYENRVETSNDHIKSTENPLIRATMFAKLQEYKQTLQLLQIEMKRRERESEILKTDSFDKSDMELAGTEYADSTMVFTSTHFKNIGINGVNQDFEFKAKINIKVSDNRKCAIIQLPAGYKSGELMQEYGDCFYYHGDGPDYDFELFFNSDSVYKIVIYQSKSGNKFIYS